MLRILCRQLRGAGRVYQGVPIQWPYDILQRGRAESPGALVGPNRGTAFVRAGRSALPDIGCYRDGLEYARGG